MMKLRHGDNFAKKAGSIWRLLFVFALMPWLTKYRISDELSVDEDLLSKSLKKTRKNTTSALQAEIKALKAEIESLTKKE